jgi:hypothetical protein
MNHPVNLIAQSIQGDPECPALPCEPTQGICAITGAAGECIPRKKLLGKSFTNGDMLARPDSEMVSADAYYALKFKWERMSSWICDGTTFTRLNRQGVRQYALSENTPPIWAAYATTSYKKHGSLNAKVNTGKSRVWLFETRQADLTDMAQVKEWWDVLNTALRAGIGRSVLESLECPPFVIGKVGLKTWLDFEAWARPRYLSALYAFLCYLLPSQEELKNEA